MISNMKDCFISPTDNITTSSPTTTNSTTARTTTTTTTTIKKHFIEDETNDSVTTTSLSTDDDDDDDDDDNSTITTTSSSSMSTTSSSAINNNTDIALSPPIMLRSDAWSEVSAKSYHVRGKTYIKDKIKQPSEECAFKLFAVDIVNVETPMYSGMCSHPNERIQMALQREKIETETETELPEFVFAINLCIPKAADNTNDNDNNNNNCGGGLFYHAVFYFGATKEQMDDIKQVDGGGGGGTTQTPFGRVMNKYIFGGSGNNNNNNNNNEYRNKTLKLIPHVVEGNYIIKHAVGTKPTILGKEMKQYYVQDERYMEVIIDISSNAIANSITKLCLGYINNLTIDLMFVLEGHDESTLPERILGGVQIKHLDFITKDGKRTVRMPPPSSGM